jgi:hypothetical protein
MGISPAGTSAERGEARHNAEKQFVTELPTRPVSSGRPQAAFGGRIKF